VSALIWYHTVITLPKLRHAKWEIGGKFKTKKSKAKKKKPKKVPKAIDLGINLFIQS
jgi:hypothetical protein